MKSIVDASDRCMRRPYLTHNPPVNMRTFPSRGRIRLRTLIARSVEYRYQNLSLTGLGGFNKAVDDDEGEMSVHLTAFVNMFA